MLVPHQFNICFLADSMNRTIFVMFVSFVGYKKENLI